jgi:hypothetical protein
MRGRRCVGLTSSWAPLIAGDSPQQFEALVNLSRVQDKQFASCLHEADDYWQLADADRLAVALGVSPDPTSPLTLAMARSDLAAVPDVVASLDQGGQILELGCGLASRLCALLQAFPTPVRWASSWSPILQSRVGAGLGRSGSGNDWSMWSEMPRHTSRTGRLIWFRGVRSFS